jgi:hypothetical protein
MPVPVAQEVPPRATCDRSSSLVEPPLISRAKQKTRAAFAPGQNSPCTDLKRRISPKAPKKSRTFRELGPQNEICTRLFCDSRTPSAVGTIGSLSPRPEIEIVSALTPSATNACLTDFARLSDSALL